VTPVFWNQTEHFLIPTNLNIILNKQKTLVKPCVLKVFIELYALLITLQICDLINAGGVSIYRSYPHRSVYAVKDNLWIGYDDEEAFADRVRLY
jgi:hypothetical protein